MMFRPIYVLKKQTSISDLLPWVSKFSPRGMLQFCVFISAENDEYIVAGSGTLTPQGVVTAAHLFWFNWQKIYITFFVNEHHYATHTTDRIIYMNNDDDLAVLELPRLWKRRQLAEIGMPREKKVRFYAFGCPEGIYGYTWKPNICSETRTHLLTRGVAIPGISGGGIYARTSDNRWHLIAVHSYAYFDSKTLYSVKVSLE